MHFIAVFKQLGHHAEVRHITAILTHKLKMIEKNSFPLITHTRRKNKVSLCMKAQHQQFHLQEIKTFYLEFAPAVIRMDDDCCRCKQLMSVSPLQKPKLK